MCRLKPLLRGCVGFGLIAMMGCASSSGQSWHWPWQSNVTAKAEEYHVPPMDDTRYSDPQSLPKSVMKPTIQPRDQATARRGMPGMGPMGGGMGPGGQF